MPVKVRCSGCQKVLNAPDKARGKSIKCPNCQAKIRVPEAKPKGNSAAKPKEKPKKKPPEAVAANADDILLVMDLDKAEENESRVCPSCSADLEPDNVVCPECQFNTKTGETAEEGAKKKKKGSDPEGYVKDVWKESLSFLLSQKMLAIRSAIYILMFSTITMGCVFMAVWCVKPPVRIFWGFLAIFMVMVAPGWAGLFNSEVIRITLEPKDNEVRRVNFDFFSAAALGISFLLWQFAMGVQLVLGIVGVALLYQGMLVPGLICLAILYAILLLLLPLAMGHISMPVPAKGWQAFALLKILKKTGKATLVWVAIAVVTNLPALGTFAVIGLISGNDVKVFVEAVSLNSKIAIAKVAKEEASAKKKQTPEDKKLLEDPLAVQEIEELKPGTLILPAVLWVVGCFFFGAVLPLNVRSNSLLVLYCKRDFKLEIRPKEKKYISKLKLAEMKEEAAQAKRDAKAAKKSAKKSKKE